jgi:Na+/melibiose symporter-like transporter
MRHKVDSPLSRVIALAYALPSLATYSIHAVFVVYHVDLFLNVYGMSRAWLYAGELWVLIVSSLNEPLFGYLMANAHGYRRHLAAISTGGALLALSSLVPYFPLWSVQDSPLALGLHFILSVYLYDALLAFVTLAHASLLADITSSPPQRELCNLYSAVLGAVGSSSVFLAHFWWDRDDLFEFRVFALLLAFVGAGAFYAAAELCERGAGLAKKGDASDGAMDNLSGNVVVNYGDYSRRGRLPLRHFLRQVRRHTNLWLFSGINLIQVFNCHFNSNFLPIFVRAFCSAPLVPPVVSSLVLGLSASLPHATVALLTGVVARHGAVPVVRVVIAVRLVCAALALLCLRPLALAALDFATAASSSGAPPSPSLVTMSLAAAFFLVMNKMLGEAVCRHTNLILSDVIDEDSVLHGRHASESTLIHGLSFFVSKPGQSIAPMVAMSLLGDAAAGTPEYMTRLFMMMCCVPLACTVVQSILWLAYDLVGPRLAAVRKQLAFRPL